MSAEINYCTMTKLYLTGKNSETEEFKKAAVLLEKVGIFLDMSSGELELLVDTDVFKRVTNRNAGRKAQSLRIDGKFAEITVAEVRAMISEIGSDATAEYLGISRRNLFYRLKAAEESHYDFLF